METKKRDTKAVLSWLSKTAHRMPFLRLVSLLDRLRPEGGERRWVRFRHDPSLSFPAGDVSSVDINNEWVLVTTTFLGLTGAASPLPYYFAEEVLHEDDGEAVRRDFLDIFHEQWISLFYRAISRYRIWTSSSEAETAWSTRLLSLAGVSHSKLPKPVLHRLLPLLLRRGRGVAALRTSLRVALEDFLPEPDVEIVEHQGGWESIPADRRVALGQSNHRLGQAVLGTKRPSLSGRFLIRVGPVGSHQVQAFMRRGEAVTRIRQTVRTVLRTPCAYDLSITFAPEAAVPLRLGKTGQLGTDARLAGKSTEATIVHLSSIHEEPKESL